MRYDYIDLRKTVKPDTTHKRQIDTPARSTFNSNTQPANLKVRRKINLLAFFFITLSENMARFFADLNLILIALHVHVYLV